MKFKVGDSAEITKKITEADIEAFAEVTGDHNPIHLDESSRKQHASAVGSHMEC